MARTELTGKQIKDRSVDLAVDVTGALPVANGGTGSSTLALNNVLLGNGTGALQAIAPGASGNVLTSDGSTWVSAAPTGGGGGGTGDVTTDTTTSVDGEVVLFSGTGGKTLSRATGTGYAYLTAGVLSVASSIPQSAVTDLTSDLGAKEDAANKGEPNGYASLDGDGLVPLIQLPEGIGGGIDSVEVTADTLQFYSGTTPVGDPISLLVSAVDGGTPSTVTEIRVDGGTL